MGPLSGIKIIEFAGIGPGPFAAMLLADLGALVIRIENPNQQDLGIKRSQEYDFLLRNRKRVILNLKEKEDVEKALLLVSKADALIEGYRPGVMERLGLGPDICRSKNKRLVYGRITGWGQEGPYKNKVGHDINYISITGILSAIGRSEQPPSIPLSLLGDYAGGSLYLIVGLLAAILETKKSGIGQVVDAAIVDGVINLASSFYGLQKAGMWSNERGDNILDSGAPFYDVYECKDNKWIAVGPLEKRFFKQFISILNLSESYIDNQYNKNTWLNLKIKLKLLFKSEIRDYWCDLFKDIDACVTPVLSITDAYKDIHLQHRNSFIKVNSILQPAPAPRFSRTAPATPKTSALVNKTDILDIIDN